MFVIAGESTSGVSTPISPMRSLMGSDKALGLRLSRIPHIILFVKE
jgi:hypothetical protein